LGTWDGNPADAEAMLATVQEAERSDYDIVWVPEAYGADAVTLMAWLASKTERIKVGSAILQIPARQPTTTAMTAATLESLFPGRIVLGLGISGPQVTEGWYGVAWDAPIERTREYLDIVDLALRREPVAYAGRTITVPRTDAYRPIKLIMKHHGRVPVYLAAIGPKNVELAGERADGWLPSLVLPETHHLARQHLEKGAARAGRDVADIKVACSTAAVVTDDMVVGRRVYRPYLALLIGGMGTATKNFYNDLVSGYGYADEAAEISRLYRTGRKHDAEALVPDALIDGLTLIGDETRIRARIAAFASAGIDTLSIAPSGRSIDEKLAVVRTVGALARAERNNT
ncbi:MAG: LLM class flavin-dependent oxidoreductase, partial [Ilumatobacteraceae bacterium]